MKSVTCDNCTTTVRDAPDNLMDWLDVGWHGGYLNHACSPTCAKAIIDVMVAADKEASADA